MLRFVGQILGENAKMEFGFEHIKSVYLEDDVIYVGEYANVPIILSSVEVAPEPEEEPQQVPF